MTQVGLSFPRTELEKEEEYSASLSHLLPYPQHLRSTGLLLVSLTAALEACGELAQGTTTSPEPQSLVQGLPYTDGSRNGQ